MSLNQFSEAASGTLICGRRTSHPKTKDKALDTKKKIYLYKLFETTKEFDDEKGKKSFEYSFWEKVNLGECCACCIDLANSSKVEYCVEIRNRSPFKGMMGKKSEFAYIKPSEFDTKKYTPVNKKDVGRECCPKNKDGFLTQG